MIKAIDTNYAGHLFRSRLEARYAVLFDSLGINWLYENEGYELGNGERYLPDFYLPDYRIFLEVKPIAFNHKEHSKCKRLAVHTQKIVVELVGLPNPNYKDIIYPSQYYVCSKCGKKEEYDFNKKRVYCSCKAKHKVLDRVDVVDGFLLFNTADKDSYNPIYYSSVHDHYTQNSKLMSAIEKAKQARFEFDYQQ